MEDFFSKFHNYLILTSNESNNNGDLLLLIETYQKDLEHKQETIIFLQNQLDKLLDDSSMNLSTIYMDLKEMNRLLESENSSFKNELEDIRINSISEKEQLKQKFLAEKLEIEKKYKLDLQTVKDELQKLQEDSKTKEHELQNELQVFQASSAMEIDEVEQKHEQQLNEMKLKQRELTNSNNNLRTEIVNLKQHYSYNSVRTDQKFHQLQKQLKLKNDQLKAYICRDSYSNSQLQQVVDDHDYQIPEGSMSYVGSNNNNSSRTVAATSKSVINNKCLSLNIMKGSGGSSNENIRTNSNQRVRTSSSLSMIRCSNYASPSLKPITNTTNQISENEGRKRKLFNPTDCHYMDENVQ